MRIYVLILLLAFSSFSKTKTDTSIVKYLKFDTASITPSTLKGHVSWDNTNRCVSVALGNNVVWQAGQEQYEYIRNNSGAQINDGQIVYVSGALGANYPTASLAVASNAQTSLATIGIATENIANGSFGYVTTSGLVNDQNTASYTEGQILYLSASTPGAFTTSLPAKGNRPVIVGIIVRAHATLGVICVCINKFPFLSELGDVDTTGKSNGRILGYDSASGTWKKLDSLRLGSGSYLKTYLDTTFYDTLLDGGTYKSRALCRLVQVGNHVTLYQPQLTSTLFSIGPIVKGIPSKFLGSSNFSITCFVYINGTTEVGALELNNTAVLGTSNNFIRSHSYVLSSGSGTYGLYPCCLTWVIN